MSAGTKADSEGTLVRPNQVNDQVNFNMAAEIINPKWLSKQLNMPVLA